MSTTTLPESIDINRHAEQVVDVKGEPVSTVDLEVNVSICIVNYNGGSALSECLRSLALYTQPDFEVVLVDNASTDGSVNDIEGRFPFVRLVRSDSNSGFAGGNNLAVQHAHGDTLVFLNPDTTVSPNWLLPLLMALDNLPQAGMVTPQILLQESPQIINTCGNVVHQTGLTLCRGMGLPRDTLEVIDQVNAVSGAAFAMRRSQYELLGGFDESFFLYMEDTDLSWRTRLAGCKCYYIPESIVYHDYELSFGTRKVYYQERNRYQMLLKNLRWGTLFVLLPSLLLGEIVTWGYVLLQDRKHFTNKLAAYTWILSHWRSIMEKRRSTQEMRMVKDRDMLKEMTYRLDFEQTGENIVSRLSHVVFDTLFLILRWITLAVVWW